MRIQNQEFPPCSSATRKPPFLFRAGVQQLELVAQQPRTDMISKSMFFSDETPGPPMKSGGASNPSDMATQRLSWSQAAGTAPDSRHHGSSNHPPTGHESGSHHVVTNVINKFGSRMHEAHPPFESAFLINLDQMGGEAVRFPTPRPDRQDVQARARTGGRH